MKKFLKKVWLGIVAVLFAVFGLHTVQAYTVNFSFSYTFSANGGADGFDVACSSLVTTNCVDHFEVYAGQTLMASVPLPASIIGGTAQVISGTYKQGPPYGSVTLDVIAVAKDSGGNRVVSPASNTSAVVIAPSAPTGFSAK